MASTIWRGQLTFSLVSFPVRIFRAARAGKIPFRRLSREAAPEPEPEPELEPPPRRRLRVVPESAPVPESTAAPLATTRNEVVTRSGGAPVTAANLVHGYEVDPGRYVVVEPEELRALAPETSKEMEIVEFVHLNEVDPLYLETSYYVKPDEPGEQAYALLFEAMRKSGYVALARFAMHRREHVVILRPGRQGIIAHTMFYPDEVHAEAEHRASVQNLEKRQLDLATKLIATMVVPFEPAKFRDTYREQVAALIGSRQPQETVQKKPPAAAAVGDLLSALEKSLKKRSRAS